MRRRAVRWIYSEARVSDFSGLSSVVFGVVEDDGCRCYCRKARTGGLARQAQGDFPGPSFSAGGEGDREDQPDSARLGEVLCHRPLEPVFLIHPLLGRKEDSAPSGPGVPASRIRLEAVEQGMAVRRAGTLRGVSRLLRAAQLGSRPSLIDLINLGVNCAGARSAGNPLATCDVAGAGNQLTVWLVRHSQRKRGATDRPDLRSTGASPRPYRGCDRPNNRNKSLTSLSGHPRTGPVLALRPSNLP